MSAPITTYAPIVEDALIALWSGLDGMGGVQVSVGPLGDDAQDGDYVHTGVSDDGVGVRSEEGWSVIGGPYGSGRRHEVVELGCSIFAVRGGAGVDVISEARDRAHAIRALIFAALQADPTLGGLLAQAIQASAWTEGRVIWPEKRGSEIRFTLRYEAELYT